MINLKNTSGIGSKLTLLTIDKSISVAVTTTILVIMYLTAKQQIRTDTREQAKIMERHTHNRREFWEWIVSLSSTGDFIQDTKDIYERRRWYPEPGRTWWEICSEKFHQSTDDEVYMAYQRLAKNPRKVQ